MVCRGATYLCWIMRLGSGWKGENMRKTRYLFFSLSLSSFEPLIIIVLLGDQDLEDKIPLGGSQVGWRERERAEGRSGGSWDESRRDGRLNRDLSFLHLAGGHSEGDIFSLPSPSGRRYKIFPARAVCHPFFSSLS